MSEGVGETLSQFVQRVMRQKGLSPREVQERASNKGQIAASYISRIYNGKVTNLSVDKILILAEGLGVNPFEVFAASSGRRALSESGIDSLRLLDTMQRAVTIPHSLEILEGWLRLSPGSQLKVRNLIQRLSPEPSSKKPRKKS
jgi:transcriptional regulator with XRE-family HTH domain